MGADGWAAAEGWLGADGSFSVGAVAAPQATNTAIRMANIPGKMKVLRCIIGNRNVILQLGLKGPYLIPLYRRKHSSEAASSTTWANTGN